MPDHGGVNVHASLLPRWRGASPVQSALLQGDTETGVTIMKMDEGMDTGPLLAQRSLTIRGDHTGGTLTAELAELGARLLVETLPAYLAGRLMPVPQDENQATLAPRLTSSDTGLDPAQPAAVLERTVRALSPKPATRLVWGDVVMRILEARALPGSASAPGTVAVSGGLPIMSTSEGWLRLDRVQLPGGKAVDGRAFLAGHGTIVGSVLQRPL
jgi:methionyl-tRNA formyltransferase